jgi:hypothetical protein
MPYLREKDKQELDEGDRPPETAGELTYCIQQRVQEFLKARPTLRFSDLAEATGAIEAAKFDFTSRILGPYENGKILENGDAWEQELLDKALGVSTPATDEPLSSRNWEGSD